MNYFILRNGEAYGPYSQADVQLYLSVGNVALGDLCRTENMNRWLPLSDILSNQAPPPPPGQPTKPAHPVPALHPPNPRVKAFPPRLHWGILLFLSVLTAGLFGLIWSFAIARWVRKIDPQSRALFMLTGSVVVGLALVLLSSVAPAKATLPVTYGMGLIIGFLFIWGVFTMRGSIMAHYNSEETVITLSGPLTFVFNVIYLQYKLVESFDRHDADQQPLES